MVDPQSAEEFWLFLQSENDRAKILMQEYFGARTPVRTQILRLALLDGVAEQARAQFLSNKEAVELYQAVRDGIGVVMVTKEEQ